MRGGGSVVLVALAPLSDLKNGKMICASGEKFGALREKIRASRDVCLLYEDICCMANDLMGKKSSTGQGICPVHKKKLIKCTTQRWSLICAIKKDYCA